MFGPPKTHEEVLNSAARRYYGIAAELDLNKNFHDFKLSTLYNLYLISSALYYRYDRSMFTDTTYDLLCYYLLEKIEEKNTVWHSRWYNEDSLRAGTGMDIVENELPIFIQNVITLLKDRARQ